MADVTPTVELAPRSSERVVRWFLRYVRITALVTFAIGVLATLGWWLQSPRLAGIFINPRPIRLTSALGFIACGFALFAAQSPFAPIRRLRSPSALALTLFGVATLADQYDLIDLGVERITLEGAGHAAVHTPIAASVMFVLLGLQALTFCCLDARRITDGLAIVSLFVAMTALAALGISAVDGMHGLFSMATPLTAVLLFANALAWIAVRPTAPLCAVAASHGPGGYIARRLLLPSMLLPLAYGWLIQWVRYHLGIDDTILIALIACLTGASTAAMVWWVARLFDHVQRQRDRVRALDDAAHTDALTGLRNRRAFDVHLARQLASAPGKSPELALLMLDADHFKSYNDSFGHPAGDEVLQRIGALLRRRLRPGDFAARIGGEEFAVVLPGAERDAAMQAAERIRAAFATDSWPHRQITVSIGVALAREGDGVASLLARADDALYRAKKAGRNRVESAAEEG